jgi:hypothetical protein
VKVAEHYVLVRRVADVVYEDDDFERESYVWRVVMTEYRVSVLTPAHPSHPKRYFPEIRKFGGQWGRPYKFHDRSLGVLKNEAYGWLFRMLKAGPGQGKSKLLIKKV